MEEWTDRQTDKYMIGREFHGKDNYTLPEVGLGGLLKRESCLEFHFPSEETETQKL